MTATLGLFEATGVELEYMIVDRSSLDVRALCDKLMLAASGTSESEIERGPLCWSNELALHVVELKTNGPARTLDGLAATFHEQVVEIDNLLTVMGAGLLPTAMHPWMDPHTETRIWPHEYSKVYKTYDRIFDCKGHGWSNLQSTHINLPFRGDEEFGRLHAAIRVVLPLLPALAASSPFADGKATGYLDTRLHYYVTNQQKVPAVAGDVISEPVFTQADYEEQIFARVDRDIAPHDPDRVLNHHFLNSRGAIARFDRGAIEIRLLDLQECPQADLAIVALVVAVVKGLVEERWCSYGAQKAAETGALAEVLHAAIRDGDAAAADAGLAKLLGLRKETKLGKVWKHLAKEVGGAVPNECAPALETILAHGPLARRMLKNMGRKKTRDAMRGLFRQLESCMIEGKPFKPGE